MNQGLPVFQVGAGRIPDAVRSEIQEAKADFLEAIVPGRVYSDEGVDLGFGVRFLFGAYPVSPSR